MKHYLKLLSIFALAIVASGCASTLKQTQSGFLGDYSQLKAAENYDNTFYYRAPNFNRETLASVRKLHIVPFELWLQQPKEGDRFALNPERLQLLSQKFHEKMIETLKPHYQLVQQPDANTLTIRGAITGIKLSEPEVSVTDFIPVRIVLNAGNAAYLNMTNQTNLVSEVGIELEFLLGEKRQRVFAMTASKEMDTTVQIDNSNFLSVIQVLNSWVTRFSEKLAEVRSSQQDSSTSTDKK